jgi:hypothetical protein
VPLFLFSAAASQPSTHACAARPSNRSGPLQPGSPAGRTRACSPPSLQRPSWPSGPSRRQLASHLRAPCAADQWGPGVVSYLASDSTRTPPPPPESERSTPPPRGPHAKESARGYLRPLPPLDVLSEQSAPPLRLAASRRKPRFPPPPLLTADAASSPRSCPGDVLGGEEDRGVACVRAGVLSRPL